MPDEFLLIPPEQQRGVLDALSGQLDLPAQVLEKDIWVCWTLQALFSMPFPETLSAGDVFMSFKGGTSLSKVYGAIDRFSEDIDITVNYKVFNDKLDPLAAETPSRTALEEFRKRVERQHLPRLLIQVAEHLRNCADNQFGSGRVQIIQPVDVAELHVLYQHAAKRTPNENYVLDHIKVEFGGRNAVEPCEKRRVSAIAASGRFERPLVFPEAEVAALAIERTFWEKVTLAHEVNTNSKQGATRDRFSRHWFDLAALSRHPSYPKMLMAHSVRDSVIIAKSRLFRSKGVDYGMCAQKKAQIAPKGQLLEVLRRDYKSMLDSGMVPSRSVRSFDEVIAEVLKVENDVNT